MPARRREAFSAMVEAQARDGLYSPFTTTLQELRGVAEAAVRECA